MVAGEEVLEMELEKQSQVLGDDASGTASLANCICEGTTWSGFTLWTGKATPSALRPISREA
jgi:hypothetical protein